ncbi:uncharacterized protein MELLADRAFT_109437 [Melampsora larici-populina 98AG31]|uniref:Uncharacterized protein n=1 Tax=Melampsora larici-populina (strain 98AG31 / pathotype 3-4-7) TaxID=747676 RepID=F4RWG9_MELLP|nr:uncharacterized protein MELLADRAFT_109437 [Melampsora larici-populina 98AG31]EGG03282.1 hypothetical protein MELLADRAFT_109437 [Melampsora larici-populina 98AG31]
MTMNSRLTMDKSNLKLLTLAIIPIFISTVFALNVPSLNVPACPAKAHLEYNKSVPDKNPFPLTTVDLCYGTSTLELVFTAYNETSFYYNRTQGTNDNIYEYEVMEAFIFRGTEDPQTYLEIEVNPGNVTFQSIIYNPSKTADPNKPFENLFFKNPKEDGLISKTQINRSLHQWKSEFVVPLSIFNLQDGDGKGTEWRMNFFRTVTDSGLFPGQVLGAWSVPYLPRFHVTSYFGHVKFV